MASVFLFFRRHRKAPCNLPPTSALTPIVVLTNGSLLLAPSTAGAALSVSMTDDCSGACRYNTAAGSFQNR
jgi:hypothetical protein